MPEAILITVGDAAQMLALPTWQVYELSKKGELTRRYIGKGTRNFRLSADEVRQYAERMPTEAVTP